MARHPAAAPLLIARYAIGVCCLCTAILTAITLLAAPAHAADPEFPALTGRVVDNADLLSAEDERAITADLEALEAKSSDQLVVVTLPSLQGFEIEDFGYKLGRHWGIGQKGKNNGVILIVAPKERKVRIEVGYGLEPVLTDALAKIIIENGILPRFRSGDFPGGIKAGVSDIIAVLTGDAEELKSRASRGRSSDDFGRFVALLILVIWFIIFFAIVWSIIQSIRHGHKSSASGKKKSRDSGWTWGSGGSSGGGWSGGGGFSGGGGGFGGGGSSGGW